MTLIKNTNISKLIISLIAILLILTSISITTQAAYIVEVKTQWDQVTQNVGGLNPIISYEVNAHYKQLRVINSYTYSTTSNDITTIADRLVKVISRIRYNRTYRLI